MSVLQQADDEEEEEVEGDRYKEMLDRSDSENIASSYFRSKRAIHLLGRDAARGHGKTGHRLNVYIKITAQALSTTRCVRNKPHSEHFRRLPRLVFWVDPSDGALLSQSSTLLPWLGGP